MDRFDAIIIGAGQAGPALAARLAGAGQHVALIERGPLGGTCVNRGCTPTKTMIASAHAAHLARRAVDYGVEIGGPIGVDIARVMARKEAVVRGLADLARRVAEGSLAELRLCTEAMSASNAPGRRW